jgi:hypothetical protein
MQLQTEYREEEAADFSGRKQHYLSCHVTFTNEERAVIDERGLYDLSILVPPDTPPSTRAGNFLAKAMAFGGVILTPLGLLFSCVQAIRPEKMAGSGPFPFLILSGGVALLVVGLWKGWRAERREIAPTRTFTLRKLLKNPDFIVYAPTIDTLRETENEVRESLSAIIGRVRANTAVPEQNVYEI